MRSYNMDGGLAYVRDAVRGRTKTTSPIDRPVETACFDVAGWPLFDDEIADVAAIIGCKPATLRRTSARPLAVWRRFGGALPCITRTLDIRLIVGLLASIGHGLVDYIDPAAWVMKNGADDGSPIYGSVHFLTSGGGPRKGGVRTACFIGEDPSDIGKVHERFVAQCLEDFCTSGTRVRLSDIHGYECLEIAENGSRNPRLPEFHDTCATVCDLCDDEFAPDGNRRLPTTWRRLLHRAEMFLSQWELVRVDATTLLDRSVRYREMEYWPLVNYEAGP